MDRINPDFTFRKRILVIVIPSVIFCVVSLGLAFLNYTNYGEFIGNELKT